MMDVIARLMESDLLSHEEVEHIRARNEAGVPLIEIIDEISGPDKESLLRFLADQFRLPYADLETEHPPKEFLAQFPARILLEHRLAPLYRREDGSIVVATSRLFDTTGLDELRLSTGHDCVPALAPASEIERCLKRYLGVGADTIQSLVSDAGSIQVVDDSADEGMDLTHAAEDASIVRLVNEVLMEAIEMRATDVHFEPFEDELSVRYRIDGVLQSATIPAEMRRFQAAIISRLKILSHLDIAEKRLPQDGRIKLRIAGREIDIRVSVIPMLHGEGVVLRLLDRSSALLGLEHLGIAGRDSALLERLLSLPHGIILVTGPTGSGKTTTLYAALSKINSVERKIVTIEDPVEYQLRGINQIQVHAKTGLTFSRGLRSILRHDPDVILVGEIRDRETADIAVQASLTGHLVFSTLHTNDAPGALTRLVDMGIEPYLVASSLEAVLAQRLVRLICPDCRENVPLADVERARQEYRLDESGSLYRGRGCRECQGTGYRGRTGVFEFMPVTEDLRDLILQRASAGAIRKAAEGRGMQSLRQDGLRLLLEGRTTLEEIIRVTKDEHFNGNGTNHQSL